ncbi:MAG: VWA domain-containing protein [Gemmataceae bacterium]|nr:VWA domain-containing protein [Gemmataceae bacterium]
MRTKTKAKILTAGLTNPEQQINLAVGIDVSGSMTVPCPADPANPEAATTTPLAEVLAAMPRFRDECAADPLLSLQLSVAAVTFSGTVGVTPFRPVAEWQTPTAVPGSGTALGEAVNRSLDLVIDRQAEAKEAGVPVRHSFVLVLTDGADNASRPGQVEAAARRIREMEAAGGFTFLPVGIQDADLERLAVFSARRRPLRLKGLKFDALFNWLYRSVQDLSRSQPGDAVRLPLALHSAANPTGWAELDG